MYPDEGPLAGFHIPCHVKRAPISAQCDVAAMPLYSPPRSSHIPLFYDLPDRVTFLAPDQNGGAISLKSDFRLSSSALHSLVEIEVTVS